eukprot:TRINITY_DN2457_c0_g1_i1.p2 TRINITY_DN2457_c0_g1~~TRINITY_DN2457_c0_g1_i1.p2  ORF type:complete len:177 (-),score=78.13 TRINITY_DN2457_c0_g1_i1:18-479(-)
MGTVESRGEGETLKMAEQEHHQESVLIVPEEEDDKIDEPEDHLKKMSEYKTFALGLMDIALLSANANQLRESLELCGPYRPLMITLLTISIVLQVIASAILIKERATYKKEEYKKCHQYNVSVSILVLCIIVINVLATAFGGPDNECHRRSPY